MSVSAFGLIAGARRQTPWTAKGAIVETAELDNEDRQLLVALSSFGQSCAPIRLVAVGSDDAVHLWNEAQAAVETGKLSQCSLVIALEELRRHSDHGVVAVTEGGVGELHQVCPSETIATALREEFSVPWDQSLGFAVIW